MRPDVPTFAVVGAVNHGKSSIVAALAENDGVRVSSMPGETVANQRFDLGELLVLFDTPGFQNARKALADLDADRQRGTPLDAFVRFIARNGRDPAFDAECRLLQPIVDGAGIIYVVDGTQPLRDIHRAEMEILRRTGAPRLAVVNRTHDAPGADDWKAQLDQHFNLVRTFDSHHVTSADRIDLIESLASIERAWKEPLREAARRIESSRDGRVDDAAALIAELLENGLRHVEREPVDASADEPVRAREAAALEQRYLAAIVAMEREAHRRLIALHEHHRVEPEAGVPTGFDTDLFAEETWQVFGLGKGQLVGVSTVAGGIAGAGVDAVTLGHSLGLGAAFGAVAGAGSAFLIGRKRPDIALKWPGFALPGFRSAGPRKSMLRFAGSELTVGPYRAANFPWILIDRAQCVVAYVHTRSHARRDAAGIDGASLQAVLDGLGLTVRTWSDAARADCQRAFKDVRGDRPDGGLSVGRLRAAIAASLRRIVEAERPIADAIRRSVATDPVPEAGRSGGQQ